MVQLADREPGRKIHGRGVARFGSGIVGEMGGWMGGG
jgi:hypothetical protein